MTYLVRFSRRTGKIDTTLQSEYTPAMLKLWALQNTTKTKDTIIFTDEGDVVGYYEGTNDMPKIYKGNGETIDKYCPGLLEAMLEESK